MSTNDSHDKVKLMILHMEAFKSYTELIRSYLAKTKELSASEEPKDQIELLTKIEDVKLLTALLQEYYAWNTKLNEMKNN